VASLVIVVSAVLVLSWDKQTQRQAQTDADDRLTPATVICVSKDFTTKREKLKRNKNPKTN